MVLGNYKVFVTLSGLKPTFSIKKTEMMKKLTLLLASTVLLAGAAFGQNCTPDPQYAGLTGGVYPSPSGAGIDRPAIVGCPYSFTFTTIIDDTPIVVPNLGTVKLTQFTVDSVRGLPNGISIACDPNNCVFTKANSPDCAVLRGTPTQAGTFYPKIYGRANLLLLPFNIPISNFQVTVPDPTLFPGTYTLHSLPADGQSCPVPAATCGVPTNIRETSVTATAVTIAWDAVAGASRYQIFGGVEGFPFKKKILPSTVTSVTISAPRIVAGQTYKWSVRARCGADIWGDYANPHVVTIPTARPGEVVDNQAWSISSMSVAPNPVSDEMSILVDDLVFDAQVRIMDVSGRIIKADTFSGDIYTTSVRELPSGIYFAAIQTEEGVMTSKFIKK